MKKTSKTKRASKPKAPAKKSKGQVNPVLDQLKNMDEDLLAMLRQAIQDEIGLDSQMFEPEDPVDLFAEFLESCASGDVAEADNEELLADLIDQLGDLKANSNGGDRGAREKIQAIYDLLENELEEHALKPIDMIMIGKVFADAGWVVRDSLKQAIVEELQTDSLDTRSVAANDIVSSLLELADQAGQNPFDIHQYVSSLLASFPADACVILLSELIASKTEVIGQAVAGFVLHPDAVLAQSVMEALAASAAQTPVESSLIERLVRMRPWLPQARQAHLDAAIRAMRLNALPPVKPDLPKIIKCYASACDGSGARGLFVTQKIGARYQVASVMLKLSGVADALVVPDLSKSAMDDMVRQMKSSMPMTETDLAGISRMLGLAIADNFASGNLPPFKLVEVVESLGLGPVHPDHASPLEIITELLADVPAAQTDAAATARAHADILDSEFKYQWFETGEALEELLYPVKGFKQRVTKLMKVYLPERRPFWARQCAISALAMRRDGKASHSLWKQLALVGRDIASDSPLDQIPLMKHVAEVSVKAFEAQLR